jgi:YidC/Oxa1 family membrane protein insertase
MDKNQIIGISLITVLMLGYFGFMATQTPETPVSMPAATHAQAKDTSLNTVQTADSAEKIQQQREYGDFATALSGESKDFVLENKDIVVTLSSKGGTLKSVKLKNYTTWDKKELFLFEQQTNQLSMVLNTNKKPIDLYALYYVGYPSKIGDTLIMTFKTDAGHEKSITHTYKLASSGFTVDYNMQLTGFGSELPNLPIILDWKEQVKRIEYDEEQARVKATVNFMSADGFDDLSESSKDVESENISNVKWISLKQKFFNSGFIVREGNISGASVKCYPIYNEYTSSPGVTKVDEDKAVIKSLETQIQLPLGGAITGKANYSFYFGPNDFKICKVVTDGYEKNVYLGWPLISWINRFVVIPVFDGLRSVTLNYGLIIVVLVLLIKLVTLPLSYKSFVSMAKMKALKPELDEIKAKNGDDQQAVQMEQMQLYKQFGINPLSGCIPVLLSMPILLAMFNFFPNSIELRGESLWWATDLSSYDEFIKLSFSVPFYGSHVSLFTLIMTVSTLVYTFVNNQVSTVTGPMKYMSYVMPVVFLFVLNSFPAGLSFYYTVSNIATIAQQLIIRRFVNEGDLRIQLEAARDKNMSGEASGQPKKNRFMQRMEEAMKTREQQQQFNKNTKKK